MTTIKDKLIETENRYNHLFNDIPILIHVSDKNNCLIEVNECWQKKMGYQPHEVLGKSFFEFLTTDSNESIQHFTSSDYLMTNDCREVPCRLVDKNGKVLDMLLSTFGEKDKTGEIVKLLNILTDITKLNVIKTNLENAIKMKEIIKMEVNHRVCNNLQMICSLVQLQIDSAHHEETIIHLRKTFTRIQTLSLIHERLSQQEGLHKIEIGHYLESLIHQLCKTFSSEESKFIYVFKSDEIEIPLKKMTLLGLIVNELITNIFKHAYLNVGGIIYLNITQSGTEIVLTLKDNGQSLQTLKDNGQSSETIKKVAKSPSLGLGLIKLLTNQIKGTITHQYEKGLTTVIRFPI